MKPQGENLTTTRPAGRPDHRGSHGSRFCPVQGPLPLVQPAHCPFGLPFLDLQRHPASGIHDRLPDPSPTQPPRRCWAATHGRRLLVSPQGEPHASARGSILLRRWVAFRPQREAPAAESHACPWPADTKQCLEKQGAAAPLGLVHLTPGLPHLLQPRDSPAELSRHMAE